MSGTEDAYISVILSTRKTICYGYSLLADHLFRAVGVESHIIGGYGMFNDNDVFADTNSMKHAWNAVKLQNDWFLMDLTWAPSLEKVGDTSEYFYLTPPDEFIWSHYPYDRSWSLLSDPPTLQQFLDAPILLYNNLILYQLSAKKLPMVKGKIVTHADTVRISADLFPGYKMDFSWDERATGDLVYPAPAKGQYLLTIGVHKRLSPIETEFVPLIVCAVERK